MTEMTQEKKKKERWPPEKLDALLELWEEHIGSLRGARKNSHVFQEIAADMVSAGIPVTSEEVSSRIKNITATYKREKNKIGPSGGSPSSWKYYDRVHRILGSFPIHNHRTEDSFTDVEMLDDPDQTETSLSEPVESFEFSSQQPSTSSGSTKAVCSGSSSELLELTESPAAATTKKNGKVNQYDLLKRLDAIQLSIDEQFDYCKQQDVKLLELEKQRTELDIRRTEMMAMYVNHTAELKDAFIRHLSNQ